MHSKLKNGRWKRSGRRGGGGGGALAILSGRIIKVKTGEEKEGNGRRRRRRRRSQRWNGSCLPKLGKRWKARSMEKCTWPRWSRGPPHARTFRGWRERFRLTPYPDLRWCPVRPRLNLFAIGYEPRAPSWSNCWHLEYPRFYLGAKEYHSSYHAIGQGTRKGTHRDKSNFISILFSTRALGSRQMKKDHVYIIMYDCRLSYDRGDHLVYIKYI